MSRPVLPPSMLAFFLLGTVLLLAYDPRKGTALLIASCAVVSFACFVILFAVYWLGWLQREHELWREGRRHADGAWETKEWEGNQTRSGPTEIGDSGPESYQFPVTPIHGGGPPGMRPVSHRRSAEGEVYPAGVDDPTPGGLPG